jgi:hypothetical protein
MEWAEKDSLLEDRDLRLFSFEQIQSEVLSSRISQGVSGQTIDVLALHLENFLIESNIAK